jgi:hypothetical protein
MQQAHAEVALQPFQALAGHGHRQVKAARGRTDRTQIEHAQKQAEVADTIHDYQASIDND